MDESSTGRSAEGLRVAIVGSGPAGCYAADLLLKQQATVDVFERLPAPFGLLRYGVAPDHQNIKRAGVALERTLQHPRLRFFGNVDVGRALFVEELLADYDQVLFAVGSATDKKLGVPGEDLGGSIAATNFVGWYNAHPDFSGLKFELSGERAVIVGMGNVALDVARILLRKPSELAATDIADYALRALEMSRVREVTLLGRRGPAQAAFDLSELTEIVALAGVEVIIDGDVPFDAPADLAGPSRRSLEYLRCLPRTSSGSAGRLLRLRFCSAPRALVELGGRVVAIEVERTELVTRPDGGVSARGTSDTEVLASNLVVRSIGYQAQPLPGLPFDSALGVIPNQSGRVGRPNEIFPRCYVVGWIKRGAVGLLGSNKPDARETVDLMLADREAAIEGSPKRKPGTALELLHERGVRSVGYADWQRIDSAEKAAGARRGKLREKFASVETLLAALDEAAHAN